MIKTQHPWQVGPTELIEFALERMHKGSDFDRRLAFLILDVGVETLFKTYLTLPDSVTHFQIKRSDRYTAADGNFHELLRGVQNANPNKASAFNFAYIEHYHNLRNTLYHQGNQVTAIPMNQLQGYAKLAVNLLRDYLDVNLSSKLKRPRVVDGVKTPQDFDRQFWEKRANSVSMVISDAIISLVKTTSEPRVTYNKTHIAVGTTGRNFLWIHPRKELQHTMARLQIGKERDDLIKRFQDQGIQCKKGKHFEKIRITLTMQELEMNKELIQESIRIAESLSL